MTLNDPIVLWGIGATATAAAWFAKRQERRVTDLELRVSALETRMAAHDAGNALIHEMNRELQELIKLTNRIAGHLKID